MKSRTDFLSDKVSCSKRKKKLILPELKIHTYILHKMKKPTEKEKDEKKAKKREMIKNA